MKPDYFRLILKVPESCHELNKDTITTWYTKDGQVVNTPNDLEYAWTPRYRQYYENILSALKACQILGFESLESNMRGLEMWILSIGEPGVGKREFEVWLGHVADVFNLKRVREELQRKIGFLDVQEKLRLNEAIHCYLEGCYYSTVAMAVTAIEFRLLEWMRNAAPNQKGIGQLTLGQLVSMILGNEEYSRSLPKKYHPLLELCNEYRIFSVHAKTEKSSILCTKPQH
jgi:hypothetical protein